MSSPTDSPPLVFLVSILGLTLSAWAGATILKGRADLQGQSRDDFGVVLAAALTLLGLIIGFSFSMAVSRYDQRKNYEEAEANAIGTEYVRADLLPAPQAAATRELLRRYVEQRVSFYRTSDAERLRQIDIQTAALQSKMWSAVTVQAVAQPSPLAALVVSGMNDVLNSQGYTQAAWWNRIPVAAWALMAVIAVLCNVMLGYAGGTLKPRGVLLLVLPFVVSVSFFLIADIDSPRGGIIRVVPQNLLSLSGSLR
jgi:hypothetical protein